MSVGRLWPRWLFNRRVGFSLLWAALLLIAAIVVNLIGIRVLGGIEGWQRWMDDHAGSFLVWRLLLYTGTAWGWVWMRRRLLAREADVASRQRLQRTEIAAVLALVALEGSALLRLL